MSIFFVLALFFVLVRAVSELVPLMIAVAALKAANEYVKRGQCQRVEVPKPSRLKAALRALLNG